jgi:dCMP deaminase
MRITKQDYFMLMAQVISMRATCARRSVGCVLVDWRDHVIATGYNGVPSGMPHCISKPCPGATAPSGTGLDLCEAIHAEQNALLQCKDTNLIKACYCTTLPCIHCIKLLMNTSCQFIFFLELYSNSKEIIDRWNKSSLEREVEQLPNLYKIEKRLHCE